MLQARFAIVHGPARFFFQETLQDIMKACIILHNMIIEDERDEVEVVDFDYEQIDEISCTPMSREPTNEFRSSFKFINALWIKKFILNSNRISLIIYGNYEESCENFWFYLFLV